MFFVKVFGIVLLCAFAATEVITFKPFVKSRYSLRARTTTKLPLLKPNETDVSSNQEGNIQLVSVQNSGATELTPVGNDVSQPVLNAETTPTSEVKVLQEDITKGNGQATEVKTTIVPIPTTQQEWLYDYYVSDDENPKKKT